MPTPLPLLPQPTASVAPREVLRDRGPAAAQRRDHADAFAQALAQARSRADDAARRPTQDRDTPAAERSQALEHANERAHDSQGVPFRIDGPATDPTEGPAAGPVETPEEAQPIDAGEAVEDRGASDDQTDETTEASATVAVVIEAPVTPATPASETPSGGASDVEGADPAADAASTAPSATAATSAPDVDVAVTAATEATGAPGGQAAADAGTATSVAEARPPAGASTTDGPEATTATSVTPTAGPATTTSTEAADAAEPAAPASTSSDTGTVAGTDSGSTGAAGDEGAGSGDRHDHADQGRHLGQSARTETGQPLVVGREHGALGGQHLGRTAGPRAEGAEPAPSLTGVVTSTTAAPTGPTGAAPTTAATTTGTTVAGAVPEQVFASLGRLVQRGDGTHRLTIKLQPEALGEVRVVLTVRDGDVSVRLAGSEAAQRALLQGAGDLQRLLESVGARSAEVLVGDSPSQQPGQGQSALGGWGRRSDGQPSGASSYSGGEQAAPDHPTPTRARTSQSVLDVTV